MIKKYKVNATIHFKGLTVNTGDFITLEDSKLQTEFEKSYKNFIAKTIDDNEGEDIKNYNILKARNSELETNRSNIEAQIRNLDLEITELKKIEEKKLNPDQKDRVEKIPQEIDELESDKGDMITEIEKNKKAISKLNVSDENKK